MLKDILIVDGYNVIFAWTHLKKLAHESLEHARMELRDRLLNYGKFKGYEVILVFDGKYTKNPEAPLNPSQVDSLKYILRMERRRIHLLNERYFYVKANILMYML